MKGLSIGFPTLDQKVMAVAWTPRLVKSFDKDAASLMIFIMESSEFTPTGHSSYGQMLSWKLQFFSWILEKRLALRVLFGHVQFQGLAAVVQVCFVPPDKRRRRYGTTCYGEEKVGCSRRELARILAAVNLRFQSPFCVTFSFPWRSHSAFRLTC